MLNGVESTLTGCLFKSGIGIRKPGQFRESNPGVTLRAVHAREGQTPPDQLARLIGAEGPGSFLDGEVRDVYITTVRRLVSPVRMSVRVSKIR